MNAPRRHPLVDFFAVAVRPRTYGALAYLWLGFPLGLAWFVTLTVGFALGFGKEFGVPLQLASLTQETFVEGKSVYGGNAQSTQIVKLLEDALGTDLRAAGFPSRLT